MNLNEFTRKIKNTPQPIIVDLWAPWCGPCRAMEPGFKQVTQKYQGQVMVVKINADDSQDVLRHLGVMGIPTVIAFADGQEIIRRTGFQSAEALAILFEAALHKIKPAVLPPAPIDRLIRTVAGLAFLILAFFLPGGWNWAIAIAGGGLVFSAFYDRCPIYRALAPRILALLKTGKKAEK